MSTFRLIALDLDGTALRSDGRFSERTLRVLAAAASAGCVTVLVTARPPRHLRQVVRGTGLGGFAICSNGALLFDLDRDCVAEKKSLLIEEAQALVKQLRLVLPEVRFFFEAGEQYGCEPHFEIPAKHADDAADAALQRGDALTLCGLGVTKLIVQHPEHTLEALLAITRQHAGELGVTHSGADFVEVAPVGVTKAVALESLCRAHRITQREVIAFGDMPNDLPMLTWAGHGVAVANAHHEVLAVADEVTTSNDDDGVARVLERLAAAGRLRLA